MRLFHELRHVKRTGVFFYAETAAKQFVQSAPADYFYRLPQ